MVTLPAIRPRTNREIPEADFQRYITDLLDLGDWRWYHTHDARRSAKGFPDLVAVRLSRLVFIEVKTERGRVRPEQTTWLDDLRLSGRCECYLWRPSDSDEARRIILG